MKSTFSLKILVFTLSFLIVNVLIGGCGFNLRGSANFDLSSVHVQSESADTVANEIKRILPERGVQVLPPEGGNIAQATVYFRNETVRRRVLTVSSMSGKREEIEISYQVEMEVRGSDGSVLLAKQPISLWRDYQFDETAMLAMGIEEETLRKEMFRDLIAQIMRRLQAIKLEGLTLDSLTLSKLTLDGLKAKYSVGEQFVVDLVEQIDEKNVRTAEVDIWISLATGENLWFLIPKTDQAQSWQLISEPQPWQRNVTPTQTSHRILDFAIPPNAGGEYVLRAVYTAVGTKLDLKNLASTTRSNIVEGKTVLENE